MCHRGGGKNTEKEGPEKVHENEFSKSATKEERVCQSPGPMLGKWWH